MDWFFVLGIDSSLYFKLLGKFFQLFAMRKEDAALNMQNQE